MDWGLISWAVTAVFAAGGAWSGVRYALRDHARRIGALELGHAEHEKRLNAHDGAIARLLRGSA